MKRCAHDNAAVSRRWEDRGPGTLALLGLTQPVKKARVECPCGMSWQGEIAGHKTRSGRRQMPPRWALRALGVKTPADVFRLIDGAKRKGQ